MTHRLSLAAILLLLSSLGAQKIKLRETHRFRFDHGQVTSLAISAKDKILASGGSCGDLVLYDIATLRMRHEHNVSHAPIQHLTFFADGARLLVQSHDLSIWASQDGKLLRRFPADLGYGAVGMPIVSPDGKWLAHFHRFQIIIRRVKDWHAVANATFEVPRHAKLRFSRDGKSLLLGDQMLWRWRRPMVTPKLIEDGESLDGFEPLTARAKTKGLPPEADRALSCSGPTGKTWAWANQRDSLSLWRKGHAIARLAGNATRPHSACLDRSGRFVAMTVKDKIWFADLKTGKKREWGSGQAVQPGALPGEFLIAGTKEVQSVSALSGRSHTVGVLDPYPPNKLSMALGGFLGMNPKGDLLHAPKPGSPDHERMTTLRSRTPGFAFGHFASYMLDISRSADGLTTMMAATPPRMCGNGTAFTDMYLIQGKSGQPWLTKIQAEMKKQVVLMTAATGAISPCNQRLTWAGPDGGVTWSRQAKAGHRMQVQKRVPITWVRYLDDDHVLSHDSQTVTLLRAADLRKISTTTPFAIPSDVRRGSYQRFVWFHPFAEEHYVPPYIHAASLSRDRKRLVLISNQDLRVFALNFNPQPR